uniref:SET domain-containing protein n=1 Tax=Leersia perrieri TaxID=77586 RepID=A0A0D9VXZ2_9ORYZ
MASWEEQLRDELAGGGLAVNSVPGKGRTLFATRSFFPDISEVDKNQLVLYAQMANLVQLILPSIELDLKEITHTFSKFACNAHTICDPELKPLGTGLYPVLSIINHRCCAPNAVLIFEGRTAYVRALQPISKNEEDSEENALLEGYRCKDQKCDGFLLPKSGGVDNSEAGSLYKIIEEQEQKLYHPSSTTLLHTRETLLKIYMELQEWQTALMYCRLTIPVYERVYPPFHPMIGLQFYTCGKLEWLLEYTEDALKSLTRAADILRITHGTKSEFMKELLGKLEEVRAEASFRLSAGDERQIDQPFS